MPSRELESAPGAMNMRLDAGVPSKIACQVRFAYAEVDVVALIARSILWHKLIFMTRRSPRSGTTCSYCKFYKAFVLTPGVASATLLTTLSDQQHVFLPGRSTSLWVRNAAQVNRFNMRTSLRFRATNLASDKSEHFTEALNISRGRFFFASSAPLQVGMPIDSRCACRGSDGSRSQETHCTARVVHVRNEPYGDGRIGFGAKSRNTTRRK